MEFALTLSHLYHALGTQSAPIVLKCRFCYSGVVRLDQEMIIVEKIACFFHLSRSGCMLWQGSTTGGIGTEGRVVARAFTKLWFLWKGTIELGKASLVWLFRKVSVDSRALKVSPVCWYLALI